MSFRNGTAERIVLVQCQLDSKLVACKAKQFGLFRGRDSRVQETYKDIPFRAFLAVLPY
jgi:hypothetical protein